MKNEIWFYSRNVQEEISVQPNFSWLIELDPILTLLTLNGENMHPS